MQGTEEQIPEARVSTLILRLEWCVGNEFASASVLADWCTAILFCAFLFILNLARLTRFISYDDVSDFTLARRRLSSQSSCSFFFAPRSDSRYICDDYSIMRYFRRDHFLDDILLYALGYDTFRSHMCASVTELRSSNFDQWLAREDLYTFVWSIWSRLMVEFCYRTQLALISRLLDWMTSTPSVAGWRWRYKKTRRALTINSLICGAAFATRLSWLWTMCAPSFCSRTISDTFQRATKFLATVRSAQELCPWSS